MRETDHRYTGDAAVHYEAARSRQMAWAREYTVVDKLCRLMSPGSRILDIPCGTGRLFPLIQRHGHVVLGGDISVDMLKQAPSCRPRSPALSGLFRCDARYLPFSDASFDYVICLRFFHLGIPVPAAVAILQEFARVAPKGIILHSPLHKQNLFSIFADATAEIFFAGKKAPLELVTQAKKAKNIVKYRLARFAVVPAESNTSPDSPSFLCTLPELEAVLGKAGFTIKKSHGAISPFSSKRIYLFERGNPGST